MATRSQSAPPEARRKELPRVHHKMIAETWEVSTHDQGESSVFVNAAQTVPISQAVSSWTGQQELPYMIKYLDCHAALSLQVHPAPHTGRDLYERDPSLVRDGRGKEESFLVLKEAPGEVVSLFLGFEKQRIAPLVARIRRPLEELATSQPSSQALKRGLEDLCELLGKTLEEECSDAICRVLKHVPSSEINEIFAPLNGGLGRSLTSRQIVEVFEYHIKDRTQNTPEARPEMLLGLEYLFSGIAVISMICELRELLISKKTSRSTQWKEVQAEAMELFGRGFADRPPKQGSLSDKHKHPILSFFHGVRVPADRWVRVPPGTIHSWQGGGNYLIELAHRSDNTFRILDFGREFSDQPRQLHYLQAMFALNGYSFFDERTSDTLIRNVEERQHKESNGDTKPLRCHDLLAHQMHLHKPLSKVVSEDDIGFLMNPDGDLRITVDDPEQVADAHIGGCRTVMVNRNLSMTIRPQLPDNRVLYLSPRKAEPPLLCLCLGGTRWEVATWRDHPDTRHPKFEWSEVDSGKNRADRVVKFVESFKEEDGLGRIGISWPGFKHSAGRSFSTSITVEERRDIRGKITQAIENERKIVELSDFQAGILGEIRHPLGRLTDEDAAMLINIDRGICVAFYHPEVPIEKIFGDDRVTICSAVGRWLYRSSSEGRFAPANEVVSSESGKTSLLYRSVFCAKPNYRVHDWVRASKYFSAAGILARYDGCSEVEADAEAFTKAIAQYEDKSPKDLHGALRELTSPDKNEFLDGIGIIGRYAGDLAELVTSVRDTLGTLAESTARGQDPNRLEADDFKKLQEDCPRRIILTGHVGQYFGLPHIEPDEWGADYLVEELKTLLKESGRAPCDVWRSEIGVCAERETAGFLYYLKNAH